MPPSRDDLDRIQRLRERFLDEERGGRALGDYWRDAADLRAYDAVLAQRIGWKWDAALAECRARGWPADPAAVVLDYGCGSGIAGRRYAASFGAGTVLCHDRSGTAMAHAVASLQAAGVNAAACRHPGAQPIDVLLVSHVLGELDAAGEAALEALCRQVGRILLVEPGSKAVARRLQALRDRLRDTFTFVAPCPHAAACPALRSDDDWCHFFAPPPPAVFTDGDWVRTARELGIDLRSLPYAFLAAVRGGAGEAGPARPGRGLGRAEVSPHTARLTVCTEAGLQPVEVTKRATPALWKALKKRPESLGDWPPAACPGDPVQD